MVDKIPVEVTVLKGFVFIVAKNHLQTVSDILNAVSQGNYLEAESILLTIKDKYPHSGNIMSHSFQMMCNHRPFEYDALTISDDEWDILASDFASAQSYKALLDVMRKWAEIAADRKGSF